MMLTEKDKTKKKQKLCEIQDHNTPILSYLNHNLEEYGPSTMEDNTEEIIIGNHSYKHIYLPNKIGNIPISPKSDWTLGDHYDHPSGWKQQQLNWEKATYQWQQIQRRHLQTLTAEELTKWKQLYHKEREYQLSTSQTLNNLLEAIPYSFGDEKKQLWSKYREVKEQHNMKTELEKNQAKQRYQQWKQTRMAPTHKHTNNKMTTNEKNKAKMKNNLLRTEEECESYFANLILGKHDNTEEENSTMQNNQFPTTANVPDLFDYMSTFTNSSTTSHYNPPNKAASKAKSGDESDSESSSSSSSSSTLSSSSHKTKRKKKRTKKHQKKYIKLFNKLCKSAHHHKLKALRLEGTPKEKRKATVLWIETIKDILSTDSQTADILEGYPSLPTHLPSYVNKALGSFLRAQMAYHVKNMLSGVNSKDGLGILQRIQEIYAPASIKDRNNALAALNALQMHPKETIMNFVQRFRKALRELQNVSQHIKPPPENELISLLLGKCLESVPAGADVRNTLLF